MKAAKKVAFAVGLLMLIVGGAIAATDYLARASNVEPEAMALLAPAVGFGWTVGLLGFAVLVGLRVERWLRE